MTADYDPLALPAAFSAKPGHSIVKCSCGRVIAQCRCPGPKAEEIRPHPACGQHDRLQHTPAGGTGQ